MTISLENELQHYIVVRNGGEPSVNCKRPSLGTVSMTVWG
jgi:hypothetical protein